MKLVASLLLLSGVISLLYRLCTIPRRRLVNRIMLASSAVELLQMMDSIHPSKEHQQLYNEVHSALEQNIGKTVQLEAIRRWQAALLLLLKKR